MPLKIGFGKTELVDGRIMRLGKELKPVKAGYNAAADRYNERVLGGFPARVLGTLTFVRPAETFR